MDSAAPGSVQPADPMSCEIDAAVGGWEQVKKRHRNNRHPPKKPPVAASAASARPAAALTRPVAAPARPVAISARPAANGPVVLAEQSKSGAVLNSLNFDVNEGLAVCVAGTSNGNLVGLKSDSVMGVAKATMVDSPAVNVSAVPPPSLLLFNRSLMLLLP
ncbi:hypothetical protein OIU84_029749 [Salix udensis]|uniref:Uncharacterized protein n=1 Tax=Salix udensis TaxID=889485 RepID=A0AAD6KAA2_9ROSI|nr:hypothetical protein OIU84_029749 [Salix udensis]